jgi:hypothetical protein
MTQQPWVTPADVPPPTPRPDWMTPEFVHSCALDIIDWAHEIYARAGCDSEYTMPDARDAFDRAVGGEADEMEAA